MNFFFLDNGLLGVLHVIRMGRVHLGKTEDQRPRLSRAVTMNAYGPDVTVARRTFFSFSSRLNLIAEFPVLYNVADFAAPPVGLKTIETPENTFNRVS